MVGNGSLSLTDPPIGRRVNLSWWSVSRDQAWASGWEMLVFLGDMPNSNSQATSSSGRLGFFLSAEAGVGRVCFILALKAEGELYALRVSQKTVLEDFTIILAGSIVGNFFDGNSLLGDRID